MNVRLMYNQLLITSILLNMLDSLITAITVFSISYLVVYFARLSFIFALGASAIFFIRSLIVKIRQNKILLLEKNYPDLRERLRTSYDYQNLTNEVIDELHNEVVNKMKNVDINTFLDNKKLLFKIMITSLVLFSVLYMASAGIDAYFIGRAVVKSRPFELITSFTGLLDETRAEVQDRELLDNARLIAEGQNELNVSISTYNTELDIDKIEDIKNNEFGGHYPEEIGGAAQETYTETIPQRFRDIIKEYFKRINK